MDSSQEILKQASGYCELGMFPDAWDLIESLPPDKKTEAPVLDFRLRILTALSQCELGEQIANLLLHAGDDERRTVARFHHARARSLWQCDRYDDARSEFRRAVDAWRGIQKKLAVKA